ncbi:MAG: hypothetical protein JWR08_721, partial [Enterovirga sp.]|nr:hypothetical protein [Enterovirga sp.]
RAAQLRRRASPDAAAAIEAAHARLTGTGETQMGALFKAVALAHPSLAGLPGLPPPAGGTRRNTEALEPTC